MPPANRLPAASTPPCGPPFTPASSQPAFEFCCGFEDGCHLVRFRGHDGCQGVYHVDAPGVHVDALLENCTAAAKRPRSGKHVQRPRSGGEAATLQSSGREAAAKPRSGEAAKKSSSRYQGG